MSWQDTEDAFQQALARASGLPPEDVIWSHQNQGAPPLTYLLLNLGGELTKGIDYLSRTFDATRAPGQEFATTVKGVREVVLSLQLFTAAVVGESGARAAMSNLRTSLLLPTVRAILRKVGISPFDPGPVGYVPDIPSVNFRGRALCDVRCYMPAQSVVEYVGYIATVKGSIIVNPGVPSGSTGTAYPFNFALP